MPVEEKEMFDSKAFMGEELQAKGRKRQEEEGKVEEGRKLRQ